MDGMVLFLWHGTISKERNVCYETTNSVLIFLSLVRRMAIDLTGVGNIRLHKELQTCRRPFR
jgi:hypothetical protein